MTRTAGTPATSQPWLVEKTKTLCMEVVYFAFKGIGS